MASAEHEPITGVWGQSPQRGPGTEPLVRGSGGEAPLKLKAFWSLDVQRSRLISPFLKMHLYFYSRCNSNDMGKFMSKSRGVR